MPLDEFHIASRRWFERNLGQPTEAQALAWPAIREGRHVLIAAPTGSGKTLAAFYSIIDRLSAQSLEGRLEQKTQVVYVSPLKALSNDIHRNLEVPLIGIRKELEAQGLSPAPITAAVRTGDTAPGERQKMVKNPPHILVTTPESLYLLLTSPKGREMLKSVRTLIVDEIHALLGDKRGSHLALSIERLEALVEKPLQRIGLSATQKPVELVARFLAGNRNIRDGEPDCLIVDTGHHRKRDLRIEVPRSPLSAVMSNEIWGELHDRLAELAGQHRTTLVFVNTRRLAERLARALAERIGDEHVSSHHGSMSKEHRLSAERRLKAGQLKVLVATASMELGIDIGSVDLVAQFGSPKRIAAFLQRVGRSGHTVGGTPKGVLFPLSRDELLECAALLDSVRRGELDRIQMPEQPLDILSQQIVAEAAGREWAIDELYGLFKNAYTYRDLPREKFVELVRMLSEGYASKRGRRGAHLYYDAVNGRVKGRRGARLTALTNGGAIPDMFDYEVVLQPEGITVGTLNEDFALESLAGDIFTLGSHSWQLIRIEGQKVLVQDAAGKPPTVPFWLGESAARSDELSESVSRLRETLGGMLNEEADIPKAAGWLSKEVGVEPGAAEQLAAYLWMGKTGLGLVPTRERLVMERFFDEAGDTHLVLHSPYGSRINRAWGLALRKKFCRAFNFELQAAADENSIVLSLSSSHSFPLEQVFHYVTPKTARDTVVQAMLDAPLFEVRWRWNATRSLAINRNRNGKRVPPYLQRMQAEDLIAQVFPDQIACFENIQGNRKVPDHPLVEQVVRDCLTEAMDIDGLERLLERIESKQVELVAKDLREPSMFAQEIINARPYSFLDDTEFAQRRVNAIRNRGWLDPSEAKELSKLDPEAIRRVREQARPQAEGPDELHDALLVHGFLAEAETEPAWKPWFEELVSQGRAARLRVNERRLFWAAAERTPALKAVYPEIDPEPSVRLPADMRQVPSPEDGLRDLLRGRMEMLGPITAKQLAWDFELSQSLIEQALAALEAEGFLFRGSFTPDLGEEEWCERRLLQRIHRDTLDALRESIQPVSPQEFMRFLLERHGVPADENAPTGPGLLEKALSLLEGYEAPAAAWEGDLLPARVADYDPAWLDTLCISGKFVWSRFNPPRPAPEGGKRAGPVKSTPVCLVPRANAPLWQELSRREEERELSSTAKKIRDHLRENGASFFDDIAAKTGLLKAQAENGIAELVGTGLVVSDSYAGLRALLTPEKDRKPLGGIEHAGRWSLTHLPEESEKSFEYETLEALLQVYLRRWGVLFRSLIEKEAFAPPWRVLVRVLRRMELRGELRGGRFVTQASGEQFALPEAVEQLREVRKKPKEEKLVSLSAADPLNLVGTLLPGKRVAHLASNRVLYRDGVPVAVLEGKETRFFEELEAGQRWEAQKALLRRSFPPKLRSYL